MRTRFATLAVSLVCLSCGGAPLREASRPPAIADPELRELVRLVNAHRRSIGCPPLAWDGRLARVAERHSQDMATRGFFGHQNPDGEGPFDRIRDAMIGYRAAAENIAGGHDSARDVFDGWMNSKGHRANLENCGFTHHGIGRYENRWTHVFLTPSPGFP